MRTAGLFVAATLALTCCAKTTEIPVAVSRSKLIGMTPVQVQACLGSPALRQNQGGITLFTYSSARATLPPIQTPTDPTSVNFNYAPLSGAPPMPGLGEGMGPVSPAGCLVNVVFDSGRVRTVTYAGPGGQLLREAPDCTEVVQRCVQ